MTFSGSILAERVQWSAPLLFWDLFESKVSAVYIIPYLGTAPELSHLSVGQGRMGLRLCRC